MPPKINYSVIQKAFEDEGYDLISEEYLGANKELSYICNKHSDKGIQKITYSTLKRGKCCAYCSFEIRKRVQRLSEGVIKQETEKRGYIFCGMNRTSGVLHVKIICPKHKEYGEQLKTWNDIRTGKSCCDKCNGHRTTDEFKMIVNSKLPDIEIVSEYEGAKKKVSCKCLKCGNNWQAHAYNLIGNKPTGCPSCAKAKLKDKSPNLLSQSEIEDRLSKALYITPLSKPKRIKDKVHCKCNLCGGEWYASTENLTKLKNPTGCPFCNISNSEKIIKNYLDYNRIKYVYQKKFDGCKDKQALPFDFYLPDYNTCIEYDGEFHYKYFSFTSLEALQKCQKHDDIKTLYCKNNNIKLIRIPFWEREKISQILDSELK